MTGNILKANRERRPLVHCITNHVTSNDCANLLLACGASPIMAEAPEEAAEITAGCDALVLNLGTPNAGKIEAMLRAGAEANHLGHPVVFDPVGVGGSAFRREAAWKLMQSVRMAVIRGNANEIAALLRHGTASGGVDAGPVSTDEAVRLAAACADMSGAVVALTGDVDVVTDGKDTFLCKNGHPMMKQVTGAGCMLSALCGAYAGACPDSPLVAALAAVCAMGVCGERAHARLGPMDGNASYRNAIIDAMFQLTDEALAREARYEVY